MNALQKESDEMKIVKAEYIEGYKVKLTFSDKKERIVDFGEFILTSTYSTFNQYKDLNKFKKFKLENGNIVWGKDWDLIFPLEQLYEGKLKLPKKNYSQIYSDASIAAEPPPVPIRLVRASRAHYNKKK